MTRGEDGDMPRPRRAVPRLLRRYLLAGLVIAAVSALGAIWLSSTTTFTYSQTRSDRNTDAANRAIATLTSWAGTHRSWTGVDATLVRLQAGDGLAISIVDARGRVIAQSDPALARTRFTAIPLDPLAVGDFGGPADDLDPRVTGAFQLDRADRARLTRAAIAVRACLGAEASTTAVWRTGRPVVTSADDAPDCGRAALNAPTPSEQSALTELSDRTNGCLIGRDLPPLDTITLDLDSTSPPTQLAFRLSPIPTSGDRAATETCFTDARVDQATEWTAPVVSVQVRDPELVGTAPRDLSPGSKARIALVSVVVLLMVLVGSAFIARPTLRGVRALTAAVDRFGAGDRTHRIDVRGDDEVARLGEAFNDMSRQIADNEDERRRMLGDVAHELRSPLTNIRGWLEASEDGVDVTDGEVRRVVLSEALRMQRITTDLLLLAQAETGALPVDRAPMDVADTGADVVRARSPMAIAAGVNLAFRSSGNTAVDSDADRLRQILDNLVGNALRHTPAGGRITVSAVGADTHVVARVEDSGEGIPATDLTRVFDRFWRGDRARTRDGDSTGLGLSIVRGIARSLGGDVTVTSDQGVSTVFSVRIPRTRG